MERNQFKSMISNIFYPGYSFDNPVGGTTKVLSLIDGRLSYLRKKSTIRVSLDDFFDAYMKFRGCRVSSTELRAIPRSVFDSSARPAGHSCNCTVFFHVMQKIGLAGILEGSGVRGDPYAVQLKGDKGA